MNYDTLLIVDQQDLAKYNQQSEILCDAELYPNAFKKFVEPFGSNSLQLAIVDENNKNDMQIYKRASYRTLSCNGNRLDELEKRVLELRNYINKVPPKHLVLASTDPIFTDLLKTAIEKENIHSTVFIPNNVTSPALTGYTHDVKHLSELFGVNIFIDYENINIRLKKNGYFVKPEALIEAIKTASIELGRINKISAYADWSKFYGDTENKLKALGVETISVKNNRRGANAADMEMISSIFESLFEISNNLDTIVLCTGDGHFCTVVDKAKERDTQVKLLAVKGSLNYNLKNLVGDNVVYFEDLLPSPKFPKANNQLVEPMIMLMAYLKQNNWTYIANKNFSRVFNKNTEKQRQNLVKKGILIHKNNQLKPNHHHFIVQVISHLLDLIEKHIVKNTNKHCECSTVEHKHLVQKIQQDPKLKEWGLNQTWPDCKAWVTLMKRINFIVSTTVYTLGNFNN